MDATPPVLQLSPEQIAGPCSRNPKLIRRNISADPNGIPLILRLKILDTMTSEPVSNALVDIWHCNARGAYSGWSKATPDAHASSADIGAIARTENQTHLRGAQFSDRQGIVRFTTTFPGVYAGRALHLHVAVRIIDGDNLLEECHVAWLGQLYFPEEVSRSVLSARENGDRAIPAMSNDEDRHYQTLGGAASTLNIHPLSRDSNADGFFGHLNIGIDTFAVSTKIRPEDFDKYTA